MWKKKLLSVGLVALVLASCVASAGTSSPATPAPAPSALAVATVAPVTPTSMPTAPTAAPATPTADAAQVELAAFEARLTQALAARNYSELQTLMGEEFMVVFWLGGGQPYSPRQAVEQLRQSHIGANTELTFHAVQDLIGAGDAVESLFRPQVNVAKLIYVQGWGPQGRDEAILYVARRPDGSLYWHGVVAAPGRFAGDPMPPLAAQIAPNTLDTGVRFVTALEDAPVYSGVPGETRTQVNTIAGGQTAWVTGISQDGKWWRVLCPDDTVGKCWVSAHPDLTEPKTAPMPGPTP